MVRLRCPPPPNCSRTATPVPLPGCDEPSVRLWEDAHRVPSPRKRAHSPVQRPLGTRARQPASRRAVTSLTGHGRLFREDGCGPPQLRRPGHGRAVTPSRGASGAVAFPLREALTHLESASSQTSGACRERCCAPSESNESHVTLIRKETSHSVLCPEAERGIGMRDGDISANTRSWSPPRD